MTVCNRIGPVDETTNPYVLVVYPSNESRATLLKAVVDGGGIPLVCHSLEHAEKVIHYENVHTVICEDNLAAETLQRICRLGQKQGKHIHFIIMSPSSEYLDSRLVLQTMPD